MTDLTIVFLTRNEHPEYWRKFHALKLLEAAQDYPIIMVSRNNELDFTPSQHILDTEEPSHFNMYYQLLKAAKLATTPYIATAESDTLYPPEHFNFFRPASNEVAYDMSRWLLYTWGSPIYSLKQRISNSTLIAPREYLIKALEERYGDNAVIPKERSMQRVGEVGRHVHEDALNLPRRNAIKVWCDKPTIQINHQNGTNFKQAHHPTRKRLGELKAKELEIWPRAEELVKEYQ